MSFLLVDLLGIMLIFLGVWIAFRRPNATRGASVARGVGKDDPGVYRRRIAGFMLAAFGLAIGVMFTTFHFA